MSTPLPPYTRAFLINYRQRYVEEQAALALSNFVTSVTNAVLAAAKQGLGNYTVKEIPVATQFTQALNAIKANFPDITVRIINLPTKQKLVSQPAIYIAWI
jgi:hypothetical protein